MESMLVMLLLSAVSRVTRGVTTPTLTLIFWGHVTSSVTWPLDPPTPNTLPKTKQKWIGWSVAEI